MFWVCNIWTDTKTTLRTIDGRKTTKCQLIVFIRFRPMCLYLETKTISFCGSKVKTVVVCTQVRHEWLECESTMVCVQFNIFIYTELVSHVKALYF